ncbi:MAG: glycoside hydrolase family 43 protein [Halioglobus sp.]
MKQNPILRGFHPDPSIIRVAEDYYLATSTFEWYPGVRIYHSRNLLDWSLVATPLNRLSQLDMRGHPDSCGVWAPCLSYCGGQFYLVYTNTRRYNSHCKDTPNYLVTTEDIRGDWSDPIYLNSSGFDPSLFHDDDGRKWLLNMQWDHRQRGARDDWDPQHYFGGILLQEYDSTAGQLVGSACKIFDGSPLGKSEGPHLYHRGGYYYLLLAEGGTGEHHACTVARSEQLAGPYAIDPRGPLMTSADHPAHLLQRAGHGDFIDTPAGASFMVHLCSRPLKNGRSVMGRETAIQQIDWQDGWPRLISEGTLPAVDCPMDSSGSSAQAPDIEDRLENFDGDKLPEDFQTLRCPLDSQTLSLNARKGYLRLFGRESLGSLFLQALVARRQQSFQFQASTVIDFAPENFQQMAGLVCYYNSSKYHYLFLSHHEQQGRVLDVVSCKGDLAAEYSLDQPIPLPASGEIHLRATVDNAELRFHYALAKDQWHELPIILDYSLLADEVGDGGEHANFTGSFVGLCCQDMSGNRQAADFDFFHYKEL